MSAYAPAAATAGVASAVAPRLRITRRGKAVLATVLSIPAVVVIGMMATAGGPAVASAEQGATTEFAYVTVSAGESLWDVAERVAPSLDPRDVIADIERLNGLEGSGVAAGESLAIPADYTN